MATGSTCFLGRAPDPVHTYFGLAVDARNTLWTLSRHKVHTHAHWMSSLEDTGADLQSALHQIPMDRVGELRSLHPTRKGGLDLAFARTFIALRRSGDKLGMMEFSYPKGFEGSHGLSTRDGKDLVLACRGLDHLLITRPGEGSYRMLPLPEDTFCEGMALGPDGKSMWVCDGGGRICRVRLEKGELDLREFPLPEGDRPRTIVPFPGERMLFTLEKRSRIGSIQALEPEAPAGAGEAGHSGERKGGEAPPGKGRPAAARMTDRERRERAFPLPLREPLPSAAAERKEAKAG